MANTSDTVNEIKDLSKVMKDLQKRLDDTNESFLDQFNISEKLRKKHAENLKIVENYESTEKKILKNKKELLENANKTFKLQKKIQELGQKRIASTDQSVVESINKEIELLDKKLKNLNDINDTLTENTDELRRLNHELEDVYKSSKKQIILYKIWKDISKVVKYITQQFDKYDSLVEKIAYKSGIGRMEAEKTINVYRDTLDLTNNIGASVEDIANSAENFVDLIGLTGVKNYQELNANVVKLNKAFGIAYETSTKFYNSLSQISNESLRSQLNIEAIAHDAAEASGVKLPKLMEDVANASDDVRSVFKGNSEELIKQSAELLKINSSLNSAAASAKSLLNFQSSFTSELKASALLGSRINLNEARRLFFQGDIAKGEKELVKQIKLAGDFTKMNFLQRQAIAEAVGKSVSEVQKLVVQEKNNLDIQTQYPELYEKQLNAQERLNKLIGDEEQQHKRMLELTARENVAATRASEIAAMKERIYQNLGKIVQPLADAFYELYSISLEFIERITRFEKPFEKTNDGIYKMIKLIAGAGGLTIVLGSVIVVLKKFGPAVSTAIGKVFTSIANGFKKVSPANLAKFAGAVLAISGSIYLMGKALQAFNDLPSVSSLFGYLGFIAAFSVALTAMGAALLNPIVATPFLVGVAGILSLSFVLYKLGDAMKNFPEMSNITNGIEDLANAITSLPILSGTVKLGTLSWMLGGIGKKAEKYSESINRFGMGFRTFTEDILKLTNNSSAIKTVFDSLDKLKDIGDFNGKFSIDITPEAKDSLENLTLSTDSINNLTKVVSDGNDKLARLIGELIQSILSGNMTVYLDGQLVNRATSYAKVSRGPYGSYS